MSLCLCQNLFSSSQTHSSRYPIVSPSHIPINYCNLASVPETTWDIYSKFKTLEDTSRQNWLYLAQPYEFDYSAHQAWDRTDTHADASCIQVESINLTWGPILSARVHPYVLFLMSSSSPQSRLKRKGPV